MSKLVKLLLASVCCLAASLSALAEPAALGRVGVGGNELGAARDIACESCPAQSAKSNTGLTLAPSRPTTNGGVAPFAVNNGAGQAVLNGADPESGNINKTTGPQPVPEPATVGLIGAGLAALAFGLKRRG